MRKRIIIAILCVIALISIGAITFIIIKGNNKNDDSSESSGRIFEYKCEYCDYRGVTYGKLGDIHCEKCKRLLTPNSEVK